jgi:hypothetical protein
VLSRQAVEMFRALNDERILAWLRHDQAIFALRRGNYSHARALFDAYVSRARELAYDHDLASALLDVGILELSERRHAQAVPVFAECLECALELGLRMHVAMSLRGFAAATAGLGEHEPAARLLGSADRLLEETGYAMWDSNAIRSPSFSHRFSIERTSPKSRRLSPPAER